jgi:hypothetical protein
MPIQEAKAAERRAPEEEALDGTTILLRFEWLDFE